MPNWVFNKIRFYGDQKEIEKLKAFVNTEETTFDFNKIVPMPKELNLDHGSTEVISTNCAIARRKGLNTCADLNAPWTNKMTFDEWANLGEKYLANLDKYGATTWYHWCCRNWGTKWNACEPIWHGDNFVSFNTAWSAPIEIYQKLTELFPDVAFEVEYADEDLGSNCGTISWSQKESFVWNSIDEFEFACEVWGYDVDEMRERYEDE